MYILKNIKQYIFIKLRHKNVSILIPEIILTIIYSTTLVWITGLLYLYYYKSYSKNDDYYHLKVMIFMRTHLNNFGLKVWYAILLAVHSIRAFLIFRASRTFGPMIEIILNMLKEIVKFGIIQGMIILIFMGSMMLLCSELPQFDTETSTFLTLFSASLASFNLSIFDSNEMSINKWYGYGPMILFLIISAIAFLNFLIAIISNVYDRLNKISIGLYCSSLIRIRSLLQNDEKYSSLVSTVPLHSMLWLSSLFL